MEFGRPLWFVVLPFLLGVVIWYVAKVRLSSRAVTASFSNEEALASVLPSRPSRRRFVPVALLLIAGALLVAVAAKPLKTVRVPENRSSVMLVLDVSESMLADDVSPSRFTAAQNVLRDVVKAAPADLNIGLVTFADVAELVVPPTQNREHLLDKLDTIQPRPGGTRTGEGVMTALAALNTFATTGEGTAIQAQLYVISDGAETPPSDGIRGLIEATKIVTTDGYQLNAVAYGTDGGVYNDVPQPPDFSSLSRAAEATGGTAVEAPSAEALAKALQTVPEAVSYTEVQVMHDSVVTVLVTIAILLLICSLVLALVWGVTFE